jgi:hypothetical protein
VHNPWFNVANVKAGLFQRVWRPFDQSLIFQAVEDTLQKHKLKEKNI